MKENLILNVNYKGFQERTLEKCHRCKATSTNLTEKLTCTKLYWAERAHGPRGTGPCEAASGSEALTTGSEQQKRSSKLKAHNREGSGDTHFLMTLADRKTPVFRNDSLACF